MENPLDDDYRVWRREIGEYEHQHGTSAAADRLLASPERETHMGRLRLGVLLSELDQWVEAHEQLSSVEPNRLHGTVEEFEWNQALGNTLMHLGQLDEAMPYLRQAVKVAPEGEYPARLVAQLQQKQNDFDGAQQTLDEIEAQFATGFATDTVRSDVLAARASLQFARGLDSDAQRFAEQALALDEQNVTAYQVAAAVHYTAGRYADAVQLLIRSLEIWPRGLGRIKLLVDSLNAQKNYGSACEALERGLNLYPGDADLHFRMASLLVRYEKGAGPALFHAGRAVALDSTKSGHWLALSLAHHYLGEQSQAVAALEQAFACSPVSPHAESTRTRYREAGLL